MVYVNKDMPEVELILQPTYTRLFKLIVSVVSEGLEEKTNRRVRTAKICGEVINNTSLPYEDDATNANTIEDESLAVLKAVDDLDLRPTTLSANFTDRPACVINFLGLYHRR
jgi:hypothetical protein